MSAGYSRFVHAKKHPSIRCPQPLGAFLGVELIMNRADNDFVLLIYYALLLLNVVYYLRYYVSTMFTTVVMPFYYLLFLLLV